MTWTTVPSAGAKLRASILSSIVTELRPVTVVKSIDETVSNSATLQDDDELLLSVAANVTYRWSIGIAFGAGTAADYKFALTFPTAATLTFVGPAWDTALAFLPFGNSGTYTSGAALTYGGAGVGTFRGIDLRGTLTVGANAGTLRYQWAQAAATVENTVTKAGSWMEIAQR